MVQATACRAVIYGFNSHPQLQRTTPKFVEIIIHGLLAFLE